MSTQVEQYGPGMCVAMIERNGYDDSDFTGVFAVPAEGGYRFERKETGSTRYGGGYVPVEDATPEVLAAYRARREEVMAGLAAERAEREAKVPSEGKAVTIVNPPTRGKNKVPAGTTGVVARRVLNDYDSRWAIENGHRTYRVRVDLDLPRDDSLRSVWLDEDRVRVTGFEDQDLPVNMDMVDAVIAGGWPVR